MLRIRAPLLLSLFFLLLVSFNALAIENCKGELIDIDDVPCRILLPRTNTTNCSAITAIFFFNDTNLFNQSMTQYSSAFCNATFNNSAIGSYGIHYSTGDTGDFYVSEGNKMIYLIYAGFVVLIMLLILGYTLQNKPIMAVSGLLMLTLGYWIFKNGFSIYLNLITDAIGLCLIGIGGYFIIISTLELIEDGYG